MVDRPNTTPIGHDRASQWRSVLFDPYLFEGRPRYFVFLDGIFPRFLGTRWLIRDISVKWG